MTWYEKYLTTTHWQEVRHAALVRADWRCQLCNSGNDLNVHHRTYDRVGFEAPADLTVLCRGCHGTFHQKLSPVPKERPGTIRIRPLHLTDDQKRYVELLEKAENAGEDEKAAITLELRELSGKNRKPGVWNVIRKPAA